VTYQLALAGHDGIVLASDKCERHASSDGHYGTKNSLRKIWIDRTGQYGWACSGSEAAPSFADHILRGIDALAESFSEGEALTAFEESSGAFVEDYRQRARGPWGCSILFACGPTRRIFRRQISPPRQEMSGGFCVAGAEFNLAAFLPSRFYAPDWSVDELTHLAAYSVRAAHDLDTGIVDGLDIAVYRDATAKFEFLDCARLWNEAQFFDAKILEVLRSGPYPKNST
jgi:20S proteasome alpha/beta subunit